MDTKALVGIVWDPHKEKFTPVVGFEFGDCAGYYQFYALTAFEHFRKSPEPHDQVAEIPYKLALELKQECRAK